MLAKVMSLLSNDAAEAVPDPRQRLREAQREFAAAERALQESRDATQRARNIVRAYLEAEDALKAAEEAAAAGAAEWAEAGAEGEPPPAVVALMSAAEAARSRAYAAGILSKGASASLLPKRFVSSEERGAPVLERERAALVRRDQAREAVDAAVRVVLDFELLSPAVARVEKKRAELEEALLELLPLAACGIPLPIARLTHFPALQQDESARVASQQPFAEFRERLTTDADAVFSA